MKFNFTIIKIKNIIKILVFCMVLTSLFAFSKYNTESIKDTILLFIYCVFSSHFPYIFFTEFVSNTKILDYISQKLGKVIAKIFPLSKNATSSIIIGFLCGFPSGAKYTVNLYNQGKLSYNEAKILLSFINNFNPIFIITTVGICMFNNIYIGILLLISHYLSSILIGFINCKINHKTIIHDKSNYLNSFLQKTGINSKKTSIFFNVKQSISNAFLILTNILGFMLLFNLISYDLRVVLEKFKIDKNIIDIITSFFEVTKGTSNIISLTNFSFEFKFIFASILLGFSGICIMFQIYSVIYEDNYSFTDLLISKIIHGMLSGLISFIIIKILNIANINLQASNLVFNNIDTHDFVSKMPSIGIYYLILSMIFIFFIIVQNTKKIVKK